MARPVYSEAEAQNIRDRLIQAGLQLYLEQGMDSVTLRQIACRIELSHTVGYRYFENKEALIAEMRRVCLGELRSAMDEANYLQAGAVQRIRAVLMGLLEFGCTQPEKYRLIFSDSQPDLIAYPELLAQRCEVFAACVELVQSASATQPLTADVLLFTHGLWSLLHGMLSLHAADQLIHGLTLREMAGPTIDIFLRAGFGQSCI